MLPENKVFWKILVFFRIFQGCFTVQLSRFFAVVFVLSSNFYIISLLFKFVNNFFIYFSIFRLKLCVSCRLCQTASLSYHPSQHLSTTFLFFYKIPILFISLSFTELHSTLPYNLFLQTDFVIFAVFHS